MVNPDGGLTVNLGPGRYVTVTHIPSGDELVIERRAEGRYVVIKANRDVFRVGRIQRTDQAPPASQAEGPDGA